jgi:hypothetical protein
MSHSTLFQEKMRVDHKSVKNLKSFLNPFLILDFQEDEKTPLQQFLIHACNLSGLGKSNLFRVRLDFEQHISSSKTKWKVPEIIKSGKES